MLDNARATKRSCTASERSDEPLAPRPDLLLPVLLSRTSHMTIVPPSPLVTFLSDSAEDSGHCVVTFMHLITVTGSIADSTCRDTVGGWPFLPDADAVPQCRMCNASMVLFLQFDIRAEFELPFQVGSHFLAFMCPTHNDIPTVPSDFDATPLPTDFWESDEGHYALLLYPPGQSQTAAQLDVHIDPFTLSILRSEERIQNSGEFDYGSHEFKIGGTPGWINYAIDKTCPCGGKMVFLCQIPDGYGFKQTPAALVQPNSFSPTEYCLFLGNQICILGCDRQCHPRALIALCDN